MSVSLNAAIAAPDEGFQEFTIQHNEHTFYDRFVVLNNESVVPQATITTNNYALSLLQFFDWRAHYELTSQHGDHLAHGTKQYGFTPEGMYNLSFLGWLKPGSLSDIKVWDQEGNKIGLIDGRLMTLSKARFDIQDKEGDVVGIAAYDKSSSAITVTDPNNSDKVLGYMKRNFVQDTEDTWTVAYSKELDPRVMLVFSTYVLQNQSTFKQDT